MVVFHPQVSVVPLDHRVATARMGSPGPRVSAVTQEQTDNKDPQVRRLLENKI